MATLFEDLQTLASHLSPSDTGTSDPVLGALIKVLEHGGTTVPPVSELLPEDHPSQIAPPAPAAGQPSQDTGALKDLAEKVESLLARLEGHSSTSSPSASAPEREAGTSEAGAETTPSSAPAAVPPPTDAPELDRP